MPNVALACATKIGVSPAPQKPIIVISPTAVARASAGTTSCMAA